MFLEVLVTTTASAANAVGSAAGFNMAFDFEIDGTPTPFTQTGTNTQLVTNTNTSAPGSTSVGPVTTSMRWVFDAADVPTMIDSITVDYHGNLGSGDGTRAFCETLYKDITSLSAPCSPMAPFCPSTADVSPSMLNGADASATSRPALCWQ
jgi:hypothetical protein